MDKNPPYDRGANKISSIFSLLVALCAAKTHSARVLLGTIMKEKNIALSPWEYDRVKRLLARVPNDLELEIITALWSERCSYKSTKAYLSTLPTIASHLAVGPTERNALIHLDDTMALAINIDSSPHEAHLSEQVRSRLIREHSAMGGQTLAVIERVLPSQQVNMMACALIRKVSIPADKAYGVKNRVLYVGADLERADFITAMRIKRACQNCIEEKLLVGLSNIGVAGLALALFTMASRASTGLLINLDEIFNLSISDLLLSEHPERLLMIAEPTSVQAIKQIFNDCGLFCYDIGRVCGDGIIRVNHGGQEVVSLAATLILENAPRYRLQYQSVIPKAFGPSLASQTKICLSDVLSEQLLIKPINRPVFLNLDNTTKNIVISFLTYSRLLRTNALETARRAVYLGALEVILNGSTPQALALCFNARSLCEEAFMTQFKHTIDGISQAAHALHIPVMAAHVEVNQQTSPNLAVGVVGLKERSAEASLNLKEEEQLVVLLGELPTDYTGAENIFSARLENPPLRAWEINTVKSLCDVMSEWAHINHVYFGRVLGEGGLMLALNELMSITHRGIRLDFGAEWLSEDIPLGLLSEDSPRVLLCFSKNKLPSLITSCAQKVPIHIIGRLVSDDFCVYHNKQLIFRKTI